MNTRKSIRLNDYDYASTNAYFITICVKNKRPLLGRIVNGIMGLSEIGNIASLYLQEIPRLRSELILDEFIVMPDHVHCILDLINRGYNTKRQNQFSKPVRESVSVIINRYKDSVKRWCNLHGYTEFEWQDRFYDRVIRSNEEY